MAANECGKVVIVRWPCPDQLAPKFGAPSTEHFFAQPHIRNELKIFRYKSMGIFGLKTFMWFCHISPPADVSLIVHIFARLHGGN